MSFANQTPRQLTKQNVEAVKPNQLGVYGIYKTNQWVYVGMGDVRQRLLDHLNGDNACLLRQSPTHWVDEVIPDEARRIRREKELILELNPSCNQRVG